MHTPSEKGANPDTDSQSKTGLLTHTLVSVLVHAWPPPPHTPLNPRSHTHIHSWSSLRHTPALSQGYVIMRAVDTHTLTQRGLALPTPPFPREPSPSLCHSHTLGPPTRVPPQGHLPLPAHTQDHSPSTLGILEPELKNFHLKVVLRSFWPFAAPAQVQASPWHG